MELYLATGMPDGPLAVKVLFFIVFVVLLYTAYRKYGRRKMIEMGMDIASKTHNTAAFAVSIVIAIGLGVVIFLVRMSNRK